MSFCKEKVREGMKLYAVTDRSWLGEDTLPSAVEKALMGGATFVQLREKGMDTASMAEEGREIAALCRQYGVPFVVNDDVLAAKMCGADGVHVGQSDMEALKVRELLGEDAIIGVSAGTVEEALLAQKMGADYIGVGTVFNTSTKKDAEAVALDTLREICNAVDIPVVAIGGINENNILRLSGSGIDGVAVVSAIFASPDIENAARRLNALAEEVIK